MNYATKTELKNALTSVLQPYNFSQSLISQLLSDEFISGTFELLQNEPENDELMTFARNFSEYKKRNYEIVQNNFREAISTFLSYQNYTGSYDINTLFTEWNLYTDLKIDLNSYGRPDGTTSYGHITGSNKRDLIFITGDNNGTTVHAGAGDDFVGGSDAKDIVYSGSGDDVIYTYGGNDIVYTNDNADKNDINRISLGAGGDDFHGGVGIDIAA